MKLQSLTRRLLAGLCVLASAAVLAQDLQAPKYDEDELKPDTDFPLPPPPKKTDLLRYPMTGTNNEVYIDGTSLKTGANQSVAYTLLVRSPSGAENVTFEVMRCGGDRHVLAYGRHDGTWSPARTSDWLPVRTAGANSYYFEFWRDVFCRDNVLLPVSDIRANINRGGSYQEYTVPN
ncbi:MAG TPA: CNP1-like family protein [Burkholderiales bacterium]|jgi:hypothetical protein